MHGAPTVSLIFNPVPHRESFWVNILKMRSCLSVETEKRPKGGLFSQQGWLGNAAVPRAILGLKLVMAAWTAPVYLSPKQKANDQTKSLLASVPYPLRCRRGPPRSFQTRGSGLSGERLQELGLGKGDSVQPARHSVGGHRKPASRAWLVKLAEATLLNPQVRGRE